LLFSTGAQSASISTTQLFDIRYLQEILNNAHVEVMTNLKLEPIFTKTMISNC